MPSALPKRDPSIGWPECPACPYKHRPNTDCPRPNVWLVERARSLTAKKTNAPAMGA